MQLDLYFDVVCPFAYLASVRIPAIAAAAGATVRWRPILLGGMRDDRERRQPRYNRPS